MDSLIQEARLCLSGYVTRGLPAPDRTDVVAYAMLLAFVSHFPVRASSKDSELLKQCESIFHSEKDRIFKQRRIALQKIVSSLEVDKLEQ